ncbi:MAG: hypothetical protein AVDCRST_MAG83-1728 [uncultured Arthrobacter sp.]|uniref:Uncharacterized protein n=1 Tax=uncultured Arthrobacter sp. TaxID=114050 RepID=A0A6J4I6V4_9MICC|nr:hypothetical protein [uncultured Arthrobacter sp.]CAA9242693.1 MAG: hypothetical protein AVDCRST_MAG83-1728 [uncultured Arthrobacter sp.]
MSHTLTLGTLPLTHTTADPTYGYVFNVLAEGATYGAATSVREIVVSLLADGDLTRTTRYGNREVTFAVEITGPSLAAVARGEAALRGEIGKSNTLTWQPAGAVATVFDVIDSEMRQTFDDLAELRRRRTFVVTLTCAPHARSVNPVVIPALPSGSTTALVDNCNTEGPAWTATRNGASAAATTFWEAGAIGVAELDNATGTAPETWTLTRTGSVNFSTTRYLVAELRVMGSTSTTVIAIIDSGLPTQRILQHLETRKLTDGSSHYQVTWDTTGVTASSITFWHRTNDPSQTYQGLIIRNLNRTALVPGVTARQQARVITPGGTERTPASIHVEAADGSTALGTAIVHTSPESGAGYSPPQRRWRTFGNTVTADPNTFSGAFEHIHPNHVVSAVPSESLPPGAYLLAARLYPSAAATARIEVLTSTIPTGASKINEVGFRTPVKFPVSNSWYFVGLGVLTLPSARMTTGKVEIDILNLDAATVGVQIDEWWLFRVDDNCALTVVNTARPHIWLDSPDVNTPVPTVWEGSSASARTHPGAGVLAMGNHTLDPNGTAVFTATSGGNHPKTDATLYRRWHSNAAE